MKINCISQYNHFPGSQDPNAPKVYNDGKIWEYLQEGGQGASALLIEPRSLQPEVYSMLETEWWRFKYIFTHDSQLLSIAPNAVTIYYWNEYELHDDEKTRDFSMICSNKKMCSLHIERQELAKVLSQDYGVEVMGTWNDGARVSTREAHANYRFCIIVENYRDDWWFTEKLLNAIGSKAVPIYFGARNITRIFHPDGIIQADKFWDIPAIVENIREDPARVYKRFTPYININYERVQRYKNFEDWFAKHYGDAFPD